MNTLAQAWKVANPEKRTLARISTVLVLALLSIIGFLIWALINDRLVDDFFKLTYQFLLIVVIGGAVSLLYSQLQYRRDESAKRFERARAVREAERALQSQFFSDVIKAYNGVKKARRLLRAKAIRCINRETEEYIVNREPYGEQMELLMNVQLDFEALKTRVGNAVLFPPEYQLDEKLESIEKSSANFPSGRRQRTNSPKLHLRFELSPNFQRYLESQPAGRFSLYILFSNRCEHPIISETARDRLRTLKHRMRVDAHRGNRNRPRT